MLLLPLLEQPYLVLDLLLDGVLLRRRGALGLPRCLGSTILLLLQGLLLNNLLFNSLSLDAVDSFLDLLGLLLVLEQSIVECFIVLLLALDELLHLLLVLEHQDAVALFVLLDLGLQCLFLGFLSRNEVLGGLLAQHLQLLLELGCGHLLVVRVLGCLRLGGLETLSRFRLERIVPNDLAVELGCLIEVLLDRGFVSFNHFDVLLDLRVPRDHGIDPYLRSWKVLVLRRLILGGRNRSLVVILQLVLLRDLENALFNLLPSGSLSDFGHLQVLLVLLPVFDFILQLVPLFEGEHLEYLLLQFWSRSEEHVLHAHVEELEFVPQAVRGGLGLNVLLHGLDHVHVVVADDRDQAVDVLHVQLVGLDTVQPNLVQDHLDLLLLREVLLLLEAILLRLGLLLEHLLFPLVLQLQLALVLQFLQVLLLLELLLLLGAQLLFNLERRSLVVFCKRLFSCVINNMRLYLGHIHIKLVLMTIGLSMGTLKILLHFLHPMILDVLEPNEAQEGLESMVFFGSISLDFFFVCNLEG